LEGSEGMRQLCLSVAVDGQSDALAAQYEIDA
jgi:hypothetical protein